MKLSELKRICEEANDVGCWDTDMVLKYDGTFHPSRVKKMIELLERAQKIMIGNEVVFAENWLKDLSEEFGE